MKKILIISLVALFCAVVSACSKMDVTGPGEETAVLSVSSSVKSVKPNTAVKYVVISSLPVYYDIEIMVESSAPEVVSVNPSRLTIPAGEREVEGNITALSEGKAVISISSADAVVKNASFTINVVKEAPAEFELSLAIEKKDYYVGDVVPFSIESPLEAPEDINIFIGSNPQSLVRIPEKLIMLKGEKFITSEMEMLEEGVVTIIITSDGHKIKVGTAELQINPILDK